jgi:hypothetical protein
MADWIREGCSARAATQIVPVRHLLVEDNGGWSMWCSGSRGLPQTPVTGNNRFCRACAGLARDASADGTLAPDDVAGWPVPRE